MFKHLLFKFPCALELKDMSSPHSWILPFTSQVRCIITPHPAIASSRAGLLCTVTAIVWDQAGMGQGEGVSSMGWCPGQKRLSGSRKLGSQGGGTQSAGCRAERRRYSLPPGGFGFPIRSTQRGLITRSFQGAFQKPALPGLCSCLECPPSTDLSATHVQPLGHRAGV